MGYFYIFFKVKDKISVTVVYLFLFFSISAGFLLIIKIFKIELVSQQYIRLNHEYFIWKKLYFVFRLNHSVNILKLPKFSFELNVNSALSYIVKSFQFNLFVQS